MLTGQQKGMFAVKDRPIVTTGEYIPGYPIAEILGIVEGGSAYLYLESIVDRFAPGLGRGRRKDGEKSFSVARREAMDELMRNAKDIRADAVIALRYNFTTSDNAIYAVAYGTAVRLAFPVVKAAPANTERQA